MIKRFNAVSEGGDISSKTVPPEKLDKVIKDYYEHRGGMETHVELNEENIANATTVFHETIPRMNCNPLNRPSSSVRRHRIASPSRRKTTSVPRHRSASPSRRKTTSFPRHRSASPSRRKTTSVPRHRSAPTGGKRKTMKTYKKVKCT